MPTSTNTIIEDLLLMFELLIVRLTCGINRVQFRLNWQLIQNLLTTSSSFWSSFWCHTKLKYLMVVRPGVDFIKVERTAQIIEIALLKLGTRRKARSTPLKSFSKVGRRVQNSLWNRPRVDKLCCNVYQTGLASNRMHVGHSLFIVAGFGKLL